LVEAHFLTGDLKVYAVFSSF